MQRTGQLEGSTVRKLCSIGRDAMGTGTRVLSEVGAMLVQSGRIVVFKVHRVAWSLLSLTFRAIYCNGRWVATMSNGEKMNHPASSKRSIDRNGCENKNLLTNGARITF